jgi:Phosphoenolpyruvate carboxykinase (ATP)
MSIKDTRACIHAVLDGTIHDSDFRTTKVFGFSVPNHIDGVDPKVLFPREAWADEWEYEKARDKLAQMFYR